VTFDNPAEARADAQAVVAPPLDPHHFGPITPGKRTTRVAEAKRWHFVRRLREKLYHGTPSLMLLASVAVLAHELESSSALAGALRRAWSLEERT
jgi:hypothetical protein